MDKNIIKKHLNLTFLSEETVPGISVTASAKKESGKFNKDGVKAIEKDVAAFEKNIKADKDAKGMAQNKFNYDDDFEKTYHDEMEIMNGQEMLQYDSKPNDTFKKRAEEGMSGSAQMGNEGGIGNAEAAWGASSDDFGKNLVKRVKASSKKRNEQTPTLNLRGQNIQADMKDHGNRPYALSENNKDNNKPQIKEGMKRLKFKKEFNGVGNALKMIPESYRVDNKQFEMTDGNETYKIRWEGNLTEGRAVVLMATDKRMVNEDMAHMKHLMGYKSQETLGTVKGKARLTENAVFGDIFNKAKALLEGEDIESAKAKTGNLEDIKKKAPEASKHIQGSVSKDKGTQAPAAKEGDLDDAVSHAPEAKKHVEGSVSTEKGTKAPAPKKGEWEAVKKKSADATKHVTMKESWMYEDEMNEISTGLANKAGISSRFTTGDEIGDEKRNRQNDRFTRYVNPEIKSAIKRIGGEIESTDIESITINILNVLIKVTAQGYEILSGELKYLPRTTINALKPLIPKIQSDLQMFKEGKFTENVYESFQAKEEEEEEGVEDVATKEVKTEGENIEGKKTKSGHWDEISVPHAAEAKKHIHMGKESKANLETEGKEEELSEGVVLGGIKFEPIVIESIKKNKKINEGLDTFAKNEIGSIKQNIETISNLVVNQIGEWMNKPMHNEYMLLQRNVGQLQNQLDDLIDFMKFSPINESWMEEGMYEEGMYEEEMGGEENVGELVADKLQDVLSPEELSFLSQAYTKGGKEMVASAIEDVSNKGVNEDANTEPPAEGEFGMSRNEIKLRQILDKIILRGALGSLAGILPAAMMGHPFLALGLGVASLVGCGLKDAAWWKSKATNAADFTSDGEAYPHHRSAQDKYGIK